VLRKDRDKAFFGGIARKRIWNFETVMEMRI
jgi:hypothetical protein